MFVEARNIDHQRAHFKSLVFWTYSSLYRTLTANSSFHPPENCQGRSAKLCLLQNESWRKALKFGQKKHTTTKSRTSHPFMSSRSPRLRRQRRVEAAAIMAQLKETKSACTCDSLGPIVVFSICFCFNRISYMNHQQPRWIKKTCRKKKLTKPIQPVPWPLDERSSIGLSLPAIVVTPHRYWAAHWW